jgi:hypothetical protein
MRIGLIPLDERPVNTRYPAMIARIAGVDLVQPPLNILSARRQSAQTDQLAAWMLEQAGTLDVLIVSIDMLGFGGLVPSRITNNPASDVLARLNILREIKRLHPSVSIYGFGLITRISRSNSSTEEPLFWKDYGARIYRYSQLIDRQHQGQDVTADLEQLKAQIPEAHIHDVLSRRLRNHIVNLYTLDMLNGGVFDLLVISSDDTSEYGLGTREKRWLSELASRTINADEKLLMYPGADEVGCALVARAITQHEGHTPAFCIQYAVDGDEEITAPFEDGPVRITVERQVRAVGGIIVEAHESADFIVAVNTPSRREPPFLTATDAEYEERSTLLEPFVKDIQRWVKEGRRVILADVAYPNGADPALVDLLRTHVPIDQLAAYGAWNTAGNTIGTALSQGVATRWIQSQKQQAEQSRFLTHRFVEDWGYQFAVRPRLQDWLTEQWGSQTIAVEHLEQVQGFVSEGLHEQLATLRPFAEQWRPVPGSIQLPWQRTFEVDFELEKK